MESTQSAPNGGWLSTRLAIKEPVAEGIHRFVLRAEGSCSLPSFTPGAHIEVELPNGLVRPYSLCNNPADRDRYEIAILREANGRGGSRSAHDDLRQGQIVRIHPPRNLFPLAKEGPALLFAGGIGITPLLAMAESLNAKGRPFTLHYAARTRSRAAFLDRLSATTYADRIHPHFDDEPTSALALQTVLAQAPGDCHLHVCGPAGFMEAVISGARILGWPEGRIHFESFSAPTLGLGDDGPFELVLAQSGRVIPVPANKTAAQALLDHGVPVSLSCELGICGACALPLLEGEADHRDSILTAEERTTNSRFTPCCSRSRSPRLVLDL
ncbi:MAG: PDR/VanB family oxidoreductase [Rhodospirillum sp.]|nr:PDR/VanB family oxidoreductase [Rhodospirillum sp.]MCF8491079.1 PDR/VanB family oxidoreductase [Rhodospirillum sp.]MCF8500223.1 PDR/VanB family oxidoreductase [Rhodospirillum sp.]